MNDTDNALLDYIEQWQDEYDEDQRQVLLAFHLASEPDDVTETGMDNEYYLYRRKHWVGYSPAEVASKAERFREILGLFGLSHVRDRWQLINEAAKWREQRLEELRDLGELAFGLMGHPRRETNPWPAMRDYVTKTYGEVRDTPVDKLCYIWLRDMAQGSPAVENLEESRDPHFFLNLAYFLLRSDDKRNREYAYDVREAFAGRETPDRRTREWTHSGTYLILTDEEADELALECVKDLPDSLGDIPDFIQGYVDYDKFAQDALDADGRAHFLSSYDGTEDDIYDMNSGETFYIFRTG